MKLGPYKNYAFISAVKKTLLEQVRSIYLNKNFKMNEEIFINHEYILKWIFDCEKMQLLNSEREQ